MVAAYWNLNRKAPGQLTLTLPDPVKRSVCKFNKKLYVHLTLCKFLYYLIDQILNFLKYINTWKVNFSLYFIFTLPKLLMVATRGASLPYKLTLT